MLQGLPWLYPNWFTEVHFAGYEPKDTKIELSSCHHFYIACYQPVCLAVVLEIRRRWLGGEDPGVSGFPVGVAVLLLFLQLPPRIFYM